MSNIVIAMMLSHFIGDFYLQTDKSVEKRFENYLWTLLHGAVYIIPGIFIFHIYTHEGLTGYFLVFACSHLTYDTVKFFIMKSKKGGKAKQQKTNEVLMIDWVFIADQAAHLLTIAIICIVYLNRHGDISVLPNFIGYINIDTDTFDKIMRATLILAIIIQPVSITFGKLFNIEKLVVLKTKESPDTDTIKGSGTIIGYLERLIIVSLLFLGEYEAIGLVIAAKSIARFNGNVTAEFYIIGTFYGVISTIVPFVLIWKL